MQALIAVTCHNRRREAGSSCISIVLSTGFKVEPAYTFFASVQRKPSHPRDQSFGLLLFGPEIRKYRPEHEYSENYPIKNPAEILTIIVVLSLALTMALIGNS